MIKIKNQRGITLVILIITIIIMLILASIGTYIGMESYDYAVVVKFVSYMKAIQKEVDMIAETNADKTNLGAILDTSQSSKLETILNGEEEFNININTDILKYFDSSSIKQNFDIDGINDSIVIDFTTREVISLNGVKYENKMYYSQYNLPNGQKLIEKEDTIRDLSFTIEKTMDGLNATITISGIRIDNGTLSYKNTEGTNWNVINNNTKNGEIEQVVISKPGAYEFKLEDNATGKDNADSEENYPTINIIVTNKPKTTNMTPEEVSEGVYYYDYAENSSNWAYARDSGNNLYVWVPKFAYLNNEGAITIQFLRGTSNITTKETYLEPTYTIPANFKEGEKYLTGVWVEVASKQEDLNLLSLLNINI